MVRDQFDRICDETDYAVPTSVVDTVHTQASMGVVRPD